MMDFVNYAAIMVFIVFVLIVHKISIHDYLMNNYSFRNRQYLSIFIMAASCTCLLYLTGKALIGFIIAYMVLITYCVYLKR